MWSGALVACINFGTPLNNTPKSWLREVWAMHQSSKSGPETSGTRGLGLQFRPNR